MSQIRTYRPMYRKGRKYGNRKVQIDGYSFDSVKEGNRYLELKYLLAAGEIKDLEMQKQYELQPAFRDANGKMVKPIYYRADFVYKDVKTGETIIEDVKCKATKTPQYNIKKKMMAYKGLMIREIE